MNPFAFAASSALDWYEGRRAQKLERERIGQQQAFNKEMFEKRYQMTMADMRKAGLNPILAYKQGAGAAPTSGGGSFQPVKVNLADSIMKGAQATSALETARTQQIQNNLSQQTLDIVNDFNKEFPNQKISLDLLKFPKTLALLHALRAGSQAVDDITLEVPKGMSNSAKAVSELSIIDRLKRKAALKKFHQKIRIASGRPKFDPAKNPFSSKYWRKKSSYIDYIYRNFID